MGEVGKDPTNASLRYHVSLDLRRINKSVIMIKKKKWKEKNTKLQPRDRCLNLNAMLLGQPKYSTSFLHT